MNLDFYFVGHRGTRIKYDENTIEAFEIALDHGANYIEFDIRELQDGSLIVIHDASLERTTNGTGLIKEYYYTEISEFKTINRFRKIPLLSEVLAKFKSRTGFLIEIKEESTWKHIIDIVIEKDTLKDTIFSGRNLNMLNSIKTQLPKAQICYNITKGEDLTLQNFLNIHEKDDYAFLPDLISLRSNLINQEFIKACHKNNILSLAWDFINYNNSIDKIKSLIDLDINGILFDDYHNITKIKEYLGI